MRRYAYILILLMPVLAFGDTKKIEGTTNVEDALINSGSPNHNYGGWSYIGIKSAYNTLIRVKNVASEIGVGATISACVCSLYVASNNSDGDISAFVVFKPWVEGDESGINDDDGDVTWNDWASDAYEWTTAGCNSADDEGVDNSGDGTGADRKATAEDTESITAVGWYAFDISSSIAQSWYDGTKNEEGILLAYISGDNDFYSTEYSTDQPFWVFTFTNNSAVFTGTTHIMDSWMQSGIQSGTNYGTEDYMNFHNFLGTVSRPVIKVIDITDSVSAPIVACSLRLWQSLGTSGKTGTLYAVKKDGWTEDGICWNDWKVDYQWQTGGADSASDVAGCNTGDGSGADRTTTSVGSFTTPGSGNWVSIAVDVDLANDWRTETECESGVVIVPGASVISIEFDSSEGDSVPQFIFIWGEEEAVGTVRYVQGPSGARVVQSAEGASEVQGP